MVDSFDVLQAVLSAVTLIVAAMVSYRAFRGYSVAKNLNLLLLASGFLLLCIYFLFSALGSLGQASRTFPPDRILGRYFAVYFIQVLAYMLVMLAYVVKPKAEEILPATALAVLAFTFELFIVLLLLVVVVSVWSVYRRTPTASTALVLASFMILFMVHLVTALLLFAPRFLVAGTIYYSVTQMISFALLFMAIGRHAGKSEIRGTAGSA